MSKEQRATKNVKKPKKDSPPSRTPGADRPVAPATSVAPKGKMKNKPAPSIIVSPDGSVKLQRVPVIVDLKQSDVDLRQERSVTVRPQRTQRTQREFACKQAPTFELPFHMDSCQFVDEP